MAEIETSVLRIGSNDLVLQDSAVRGSLAAAYSASSTYAVGDMVLKDGQLYECNTAITTAEAWTAAHWTAVTVGEKVADLKDETTSLKEEYSDILNSAYVTDTVSGSIVSFPDGADGVPVKSLTVNIEPVQSGSGDPSPDNVRPISGHTQAAVTRTGKNLFDFKSDYSDWVGGYIKTDGTINGITPTAPAYERTSPFIGIKGGTTYTFSVDIDTTSQKSMNWAFYDSDKNFVNGTYGGQYSGNPITVNAPSTAAYLRVSMRTYNIAKDCQLELGSTATPYEPYSGQTYTIDLGGTIYGGTLDVTTGVLTVDRALITLDGSNDENWAASGSKFYSTAMLDTKSNAQAICNQYKYSGISSGGSSTVLIDKSFYLQPANNRIWVYDTGHSDLTSFKTALGNNPLVVAYEIATPTTVQLIPQEVKTLLGNNNIFADTGNSTVEYRADTKLYIEKLTAPTEDDMIADHAISANSFFMVGNTLYRATTAIASGATITVGTNATKLSLSDALNALA